MAEASNKVHREQAERMQRYAAYEKRKLEELSCASESPTTTAEDAVGTRTARKTIIIGDSPTGEEPRKKLFSEVPSIVGELVLLDRVVDGDAEALHDLIHNPLVQRYLPAFLFENQRDDIHESISMLYGDLFTNKESLILAIRVKETGELAGLAEFYGLRDSLHKVSIGARLRECWWGHGFATEVARLMVDYLYEETDIEIITVSSMIENRASAHTLEKAGFIHTQHNAEEDWGFAEPTLVDKWFY